MAEEAVVGLAADSDAVDIEFHGALYSISIQTIGEDVLVVEIEDKDSYDRWRGEFAAKYVEDITGKTGSFKKFAVFVRMLRTAVLQQSDSVYIDLLTYQDLELLKSKKAAAVGTSSNAAAPTRQLPASNKRYLIMTYASEFDRVHYPLPLLHEGLPDPQRLKAVIQQLRQQLQDVTEGQQQQIARLQHQSSRRHSQVRDPSAEPDAAVLSSRLEVMAAQLERERAEHKRELRRSARQLQELQEELSRSHDVARQLRLKLKACEQELQAVRDRQQQQQQQRSSASGIGSNRRSGGGNSSRYDASGWARGSGSSYLSGGNTGARQYSKYPTRGSRNAKSSELGSSRGSSPASSRAQSPGYSKPWQQNTTPPRPPRPSSAPPKQRFDPTEYVRQKQAKLATQRSSNSRGSSPARSRGPSSNGAGSGTTTPRALASPAGHSTRHSYGGGSSSTGVSRQNSVERRRTAVAAAGSGTGSRTPGYLRPTLSNGSGGGSMHATRGLDAAAGGMRRSSSRERLGAVYGVHSAAAAAAAGVRDSSRSGSRQEHRPASRDGPGAASPGRALQGVKDKLNAFMAKQQQQQQLVPQQQIQSQSGIAAQQHQQPVATEPTAAAAVGAGQLVAQGSRVFEDASSEIASIDQRLHALQDFLKKAKSSVVAG